MSEPFLRLLDVTKRQGPRAVVDSVTLEISHGETVALLGPSGCGKTTLLRLISGLETPDSGEIWIANQCASSAGRNLIPPRLRGIGFVFQDLALWPHLTVRGNLEFALGSVGFPKRERAGRIDEVLRLVRIAQYGDRFPGQLSGGEQQRAAIARAIVGSPRLLLLDEPMSSLDADLKAELQAELMSLHRLLTITTIYVTHDRAEAMALADRVCFMRDGRIDDVRSAEALRTRELGS
jgi:iron(III) transport system ATP-binding protein